MKRKPERAPVWADMIDELVGCGKTLKEIANEMGMSSGLTERILRFYRMGAQPLYWRGAALVAYWSEVTGKPASEVPMQNVPQGFRIPRGQVDRSPSFGPAAPTSWPPVAVATRPTPQPSVQPIKRKGRPPKLKVEA